MKSIRLFIFIISFTGIAGEGILAQSLYVKEKSGSLTTYSLASIQKLTFTPGILSIMNTTGNSESYWLEELRFLTFSDIIIGIDHPERAGLKDGFRIFPNPVKEYLTISSFPDEALNGLVEVAGLDGNVIKSSMVTDVTELKIDVQDLVDGIYICRLSNKKGWHTEKFIKSR